MGSGLLLLLMRTKLVFVFAGILDTAYGLGLVLTITEEVMDTHTAMVQTLQEE
jgi:hypothetical protein